MNKQLLRSPLTLSVPQLRMAGVM